MAVRAALPEVGVVHPPSKSDTNSMTSDVVTARPQIVFSAILEINLIIICSSVPVVYPILSGPRTPRSSVSRSAGRVFGSTKRPEDRRNFDPLDDSADNLNANNIRLDTVFTIEEEVGKEATPHIMASNNRTGQDWK
jgi:hypothetical protein